jgi:hypothetical protein
MTSDVKASTNTMLMLPPPGPSLVLLLLMTIMIIMTLNINIVVTQLLTGLITILSHTWLVSRSRYVSGVKLCISTASLTMLLVTKECIASNDWIMVDNVLKRTWKEVTMILFKTLYTHLTLTFQKFRQKSNFAQVGLQYTYGQV